MPCLASSPLVDFLTCVQLANHFVWTCCSLSARLSCCGMLCMTPVCFFDPDQTSSCVWTVCACSLSVVVVLTTSAWTPLDCGLHLVHCDPCFRVIFWSLNITGT